MFLRAAYGYDADVVSAESGLVCPEEEGMTQQQFKEESDINVLLERFGVTGELPVVPRMPLSGEFHDVADFHSAMNAVRAAEEQFGLLPAEMRARFGHDPGMLIAFLENPENREEAVKLGLVEKPPEKTRDVVAAVDELAAKLTVKA